MPDAKLTPMMQQYQAMRRSLPDDVILMYRLGDFYEMFFEDAKNAAPILNVALTRRNEIPMCGVPYHAAETYLARLLKAGKRVAIAEQTSTPTPGKLVEREISRILTAGSIDQLNLLDDQRPNFLAALTFSSNTWGLAWLDHTTGQFTLLEHPNPQAILDQIARINPSELLIPENPHHQLETLLTSTQLPSPVLYERYAFLPDHAAEQLKDHFKIHSLDGFGASQITTGIGAAGAILHYLRHQLRRSCDHIRHLKIIQPSDFVLIDASSQKNLDLVDSPSGRTHSLLGILDHTHTPMGSRLLREWLLSPLRNLTHLTARQDRITSLLNHPNTLLTLRNQLKHIRDVERTTSRLSQGSGNPRDLHTLMVSLAQFPEISQTLQNFPDFPQLQNLTPLQNLLARALRDEPPISFKDGGIIREEYSPELRELQEAARHGKDWIARLQDTERKRSGIDSLKIKYTSVFGYFIEISSAQLAKVPSDYQRKQTLANAERFITDELKQIEHKVLGAEERIKQLEADLFLQLRSDTLQYLDTLQHNAQALAQIDVLASLAHHAQRHNHSRPQLENSSQLILTNARHPILEANLQGEKVIPNNTSLNHDSSRLQILTGPNMAGKSTYLRQVALITLIAQIGAFVPAQSATIGLVDRIFCRVGASDNLAKGQSTFMVEMNETALILNHATQHSLVILDEIGRGTATFDGLSIAWSVAEFLHDSIQARTIFATHYHELTELASTRETIHNLNVAVREWNEQIIFLRKILPGPADQSYGIQVARLAGLPPSVLNRAKTILTHLELQSHRPQTPNSSTSSPPEIHEPHTTYPHPHTATPKPPNNQLDLFS